MTETSIRAQAVADILWELKKADKLATLTSIAGRAGFPPGVNCKTVSTTLKIVRRDWPHLQWWRAVADNGRLEEDQKTHLAKAGFGSQKIEGHDVLTGPFEEQLMTWQVTASE